MNKRFFFFVIYFVFVLFENISCHSKNKNIVVQNRVYKDTMIITGLNEAKNIVAYYYGKKNIGKGDIK